jgi:phosphatidate cytidylyltransferase
MSADPASRRKVAARIIGAPLLLGGVAGVIGLDIRWGKPLAVTVLLGLFALVSFRELCAMARRRELRPAEEAGCIALASMFAAQFLRFLRDADTPFNAGMILLACLVVLLVLLVFRFGRFSPPDAGFTLLALAYVSLLMFVTAPLEERLPLVEWNRRHGMWFLVFLVAANKGSDMAAYALGRMFGRHKLAPVVSPNKTWEGALGGLVAGTCIGAIVLERSPLRSAWDPAPPIWIFAIYAAVVTVAAQVGDLVKSAVKRWAGVKDSGQLLPEFGGALDMCDSFILSAPVAWIGLQLL